MSIALNGVFLKRGYTIGGFSISTLSSWRVWRDHWGAAFYGEPEVGHFWWTFLSRFAKVTPIEPSLIIKENRQGALNITKTSISWRLYPQNSRVIFNLGYLPMITWLSSFHCHYITIIFNPSSSLIFTNNGWVSIEELQDPSLGPIISWANPQFPLKISLQTNPLKQISRGQIRI